MVCKHAHSVISFITICARPWQKRFSPLALMHVHNVLVMDFPRWWSCPALCNTLSKTSGNGYLLIWCVIALLKLTPLPHPRVKVSIVGSLRDREVACSASDRQGSNFESCVWRTVSSQSSHHPQEAPLAQFSLYVHKGGLKPDSFHFSHSQYMLRATCGLKIFRRQ